MTLTHIIALMAMLIAQRPDSCSGYVCVRHPCLSRRIHPVVRMSTATEEETQTVLPDHPSKRKRLSSITRRLRAHLSWALHRKSKEPLVPEEPGAGLMLETPTTNEPPLVAVETPTTKELSLEALPLETLLSEAQEPTAPSEETAIANSLRRSTAAEHVDLSGTWKPIVTEQFKANYDEYLRNCSQSFAFRTIAVRGISFQTEVVRQYDDGTNLEIVATNPAGNWNRTLVASGADTPRNYTVVDPDGDAVQVEAWWEGDGTRHKSVLRGKPRVKGGVFETVRYIDESEEDVLVCESSFVPEDSSSKEFKFGHVVWRFQRV